MEDRAFPELAPRVLLQRLLGIPGRPPADRSPPELQPAESLAASPYHVPWAGASQAERRDLLRDELPPAIGFTTSGHTGSPVLWVRTRDQLMAEAGLLSAVLGTERIDAIIAFAPLHHLYGFLGSFLLPATTGIDAWLWPMQYQHSVRFGRVARPLFVAIPSALARLERQADGLSSYEHVTIVHSTAMLPPAGRRLLRRLTPARLTLVELFGSTETGLVAVRTNSHTDRDPWELAPDVEALCPASGDEVSLGLRSPRLASDERGNQLSEWWLDDVVRFYSPRQFSFEGRRSLLVKVNGRRVHLTRVEDRIRDALPCLDLACVPTRDELRGEGYDVLIVRDPERPVSVAEARRTCRAVLRDVGPPRFIRLVSEIARTPTGKVRLGSVEEG